MRACRSRSRLGTFGHLASPGNGLQVGPAKAVREWPGRVDVKSAESAAVGRQRKSPQKKKNLELKKDRYTFAEYPHGFRKAWPLKKALANREYRRKADELLSQAKTGMSSEDVDPVAGGLTAAQIRNSVSRKRLRKWGTVSAGEKIRMTLEKRTERVGRRVDAEGSGTLRIFSALEKEGERNSCEVVPPAAKKNRAEDR